MILKNLNKDLIIGEKEINLSNTGIKNILIILIHSINIFLDIMFIQTGQGVKSKKNYSLEGKIIQLIQQLNIQFWMTAEFQNLLTGFKKVRWMNHYNKELAEQLTHFQQQPALKVLILLSMDNYWNYLNKNVLIVMINHLDAMVDMLKIVCYMLLEMLVLCLIRIIPGLVKFKNFAWLILLEKQQLFSLLKLFLQNLLYN